MLRNGALLQEKADQAKVVVEAWSGALSIDSGESLGGVPAIPVPIPGAGTLKTPEVALFKVTIQNSVAKLALTAYEKSTGKHLFSANTLVGKARFDRYTILGDLQDLHAHSREEITENTQEKRRKVLKDRGGGSSQPL